MSTDDELFHDIVRRTWGDAAPVFECETEEEPKDWLGFSHQWVAAFGLADSDEGNGSHAKTIKYHLRENLPSVIDWLIKHKVVDELAEDYEREEFVPELSEILMMRVGDSHYDGLYCDGCVGQQSIALFDWGRLAIAFTEAYEARRN